MSVMQWEPTQPTQGLIAVVDILTKREVNPFAMRYDPKMCVSPEISPDAASQFQHMIGVLRCLLYLGRVDIISKLSLLQSHLALLSEEHLVAEVHTMAYMDQKYNSSLVYYPTFPDKDHSIFQKCD